ncbi:Uma2 family endonuclease [Kaistia dalseonensis]|uniref:Uma2 family endonuclease n=1 Tax=Kaistia dalseonensis TaxID=410840 RepID=A0ABU0HC76_9HYPH|nr:Uma2 family endonuclease [Kaistia dalseonensis]MCX5497270.1 Uma2 family endonuclease [Kaistia dalseonensis]MDQ0439906.1 Uma2 family endonuclease [Kaistia dalseonensis]
MNIRSLIGTDDLPRRTFTVAEVERMGEVGLIRDDERVELIGGELVPMNAKGSRHETLKLEIMLRWGDQRPPSHAFIPETTLRLAPDTFLEPDFLVFARETALRDLGADTVLLAVEISDSSLGFDLGVKSLIYAHFGIRELWVIDVMGMVIHVHRDPAGDRYRSITPWHIDDLVVPAFAPSAFALRLADLHIGE